MAENLGHYESGGIWQILVDSPDSDRLRLIFCEYRANWVVRVGGSRASSVKIC